MNGSSYFHLPDKNKKSSGKFINIFAMWTVDHEQKTYTI